MKGLLSPPTKDYARQLQIGILNIALVAAPPNILVKFESLV